MTTAALSAQEEAIESGQKFIHGTVTDRVLRMYDAIRAYGPPRVTLDRAVLFTESFQATENQPLVLRWAKALKHFVENVPATIFPDEFLVGRPNTWFGKWGIVYPELDGSVTPAGVDMFKKNKGKPGDVTVTEEDDKIISEVLTPYWAGRDFSTNFIKSLPEETRFGSRRPDAGRQGRDQRADPPHPRIDACAVAHDSRTVHPDPLQYARQPFASRRGSRQGRGRADLRRCCAV